MSEGGRGLDGDTVGDERSAPVVEPKQVMSERSHLLRESEGPRAQVDGLTAEAQRMASLERDNGHLRDALEQARRERDQALLHLLEAEQELVLHRTGMPTDR